MSKGDDELTYAYDAAGGKLAKHYNGQLTQRYAGSVVYKGDGTVDYLLHPEGMVRVSSDGLHYQYHLTDHLSNVRAVVDESGTVQQATDYYPFGLAHELENLNKNKYLYNSKEIQDEVLGGTLYGILDYHARGYDPDGGRFTTRDPLTEKFFSTSSYAYCGNNPINRIDSDGREWNYVVDANGHTTINVMLNFSISGNFTTAQIDAYKNAIATQFQNTIFESSGGTMSGTVTFEEGNPNIVQELSLDRLQSSIGGSTVSFTSSVNLFNSTGELHSVSSVGETATHELLHTLRLDHPFETTQTEDTKLLRVAPNSFVSTPTTDKNIVNNIMSYPMITIDGLKSNNRTALTKGQLNFMLNEINLQNQGYGFVPKYNSALTSKQNVNLIKKYYENYWINTPGTPVGNR